MSRQVDVPTTAPLHVAVVGAGPAGLAFATVAARRGYRVTLYDGADKIGGQFNLAKRVPGKEEFYETLRYFAHELREAGVDVRLNTRVDRAPVGPLAAAAPARGHRPPSPLAHPPPTPPRLSSPTPTLPFGRAAGHR